MNVYDFFCIHLLFKSDSFRSDLINKIDNNSILEGDITGFFDACKASKRHTGVSQAPFLRKEFNKEIMTRSKLRKKYFILDLMKTKTHKTCNTNVV